MEADKAAKQAEENQLRALEQRKKEEEDKLAAEKEFMEKFHKERRLSSSRALSTSSQAEGDSESEVERKKRTRSKESPEYKEMKRQRELKSGDEEEEEYNEEGEEEPVKMMVNLLRKMREWWKQPTIVKMVSKSQTERFGRYMDMMDEAIVRVNGDSIRMKTKIEERSELIRIVRTTVQEELRKGSEEGKGESPMVLSYASATAKKAASRVPKVSGVKGPVLPPPKIVTVRHERKESEEVKTMLMKLVKPSEIGLKVRRVIKIRNGVIVEADTEEGADNLVMQKSLKDAGLKVEKPTRKRPIIMIYDVSTELKDEDVKDEVYKRNMNGSGVSEQEFDQEFVIKHKYKDVKSNGKKNHIVVECSVRVRNWLRFREKVFIEWQGCRVKDYVDVARCFKCQRYGHIAKHCNNEKPSCSHCAGDHDYKECPNKNKKEAVCCSNCKREGRQEVKHDATSRKCPAYEKAVKRQNEKTDYGL